MALEIRFCDKCKTPRAHDVQKGEGGTTYSCKVCDSVFTEEKEVHAK